MVKKKFIYWIVPSKKKGIKGLFSLVCSAKNKRKVIVDDIAVYYIIGNYVVYRRKTESVWYMRVQNSKAIICLGYAQSSVYFSLKENDEKVISFFNQRGNFVTKRYYYCSSLYFDWQHFLVGYTKDGNCDVFKIESGANLGEARMIEFFPKKNMMIRDNSAVFTRNIRYNKRKKCWKEVDVEVGWFEKIMNWFKKILP